MTTSKHASMEATAGRGHLGGFMDAGFGSIKSSMALTSCAEITLAAAWYEEEELVTLAFRFATSAPPRVRRQSLLPGTSLTGTRWTTRYVPWSNAYLLLSYSREVGPKHLSLGGAEWRSERMHGKESAGSKPYRYNEEGQ